MFKLGQIVQVRESRYGREDVWREYTVTKVGRKWVSFGYAGRALFRSRQLESGAQVWASQDEYAEHAVLQKDWLALKGELGNMWNRPEHITAEIMRQIRNLLKAPE